MQWYYNQYINVIPKEQGIYGFRSKEEGWNKVGLIAYASCWDVIGLQCICNFPVTCTLYFRGVINLDR